MYKLVNSISSQQFVIRLDDNTHIPFDPANTDYQAFTQWLNDGNVPTPADDIGVDNGKTTE